MGSLVKPSTQQIPLSFLSVSGMQNAIMYTLPACFGGGGGGGGEIMHASCIIVSFGFEGVSFRHAAAPVVKKSLSTHIS